MLRPDTQRNLPAAVPPGPGRKRDPAVGAGHEAVTVDSAFEYIHSLRADELGDEQVGGPVIEFHRLPDLLRAAFVEHQDPVGHGHGFQLIMRHIYRRIADPAVQLAQFRPHLTAQLGVQIGKRLVEQENRRIAHDRPAHGHPLALPSGQLPRQPVEVIGKAEQFGGPPHLLVDLLLAGPPHPEREGHVFRHAEVRVQRVRLEYHRDVPLLGRNIVDDPVIDADFAAGYRFQPGNHPQQGRLAATGRSDKHQKGAPGHRHGNVPNDFNIIIGLADVLQRQTGQSGPSFMCLESTQVSANSRP